MNKFNLANEIYLLHLCYFFIIKVIYKNKFLKAISKLQNNSTDFMTTCSLIYRFSLKRKKYSNHLKEGMSEEKCKKINYIKIDLQNIE